VQRSVIGLFLDVDHLKGINDTHGHAERDRALYLAAHALRAAVKGGLLGNGSRFQPAASSSRRSKPMQGWRSLANP
jgi:hypothetical protein